MYTEQELSVLEILEGHALPTIVLSSPRVQLPILAKCYVGNIDMTNYTVHLCIRIRRLLEPQHNGDRSDQEIANLTAMRELLSCISKAIEGTGTLSRYIGGMYGDSMHVRFMKDPATKLSLRNVWIKQTLADYLTTVEEQLLRESQNGQL